MKHLRHLFLAFLLLFVSAAAMAQTRNENTEKNTTEWAARADVNGDGVVNEADIAEILAIMKQNSKQKYYWYVGQTDPVSNSTITSTIGAEGWRLISNPNTVSQSNPLFDTTTTSDDRIVGTSKTYWFIALPADKSYKIYDSDYADQITAGNFEKQSSTVTFNNVKYTVYKGVGTARNFDGYTIY